MSQNQAGSIIVAGTVEHPRRKLVIFDDSMQTLARLADEYTAHGFDVTALLVVGEGKCETSPELKKDGTLKTPQPPITRGICSKADLRNVLLELKPDALLSDGNFANQNFRIRTRDQQVRDGAGIIDEAKKYTPGIVCVVHTAVLELDSNTTHHGYRLARKTDVVANAQYIHQQLDTTRGASIV